MLAHIKARAIRPPVKVRLVAIGVSMASLRSMVATERRACLMARFLVSLADGWAGFSIEARRILTISLTCLVAVGVVV